MYEFNYERLLLDSDEFSRWKAQVFSASCAEVLISCYRKFSEIEGVGNPDYLEGLLGSIWDALLDPEGAERGSDFPTSNEILAMLPNQDEEWNEWSACAENAVAALALLLDLMSDGTLDIRARVAQQAYEAVDWLAADELDPPFVDAQQAAIILSSDIVQVELGRQSAAIQALRAASDGQVDVAASLRRNAMEFAVSGRRN